MATLNEMHKKAMKLHSAIEQHEGDGRDAGKQELVSDCMNQFQDLWRAVDGRKVFSSNEEKDDVATGDLKFFLVLYYVGDLYERVVDTRRISNLKNAINCFRAFFKLCLDYDIISEKEHEQLITPINPTDRVARVERLKKQKELQAKLAELADRKKKISRNINNEAKEGGAEGGEEEGEFEIVERQYWMLAVEERLRVCSQQFFMSMRECEMLSSLNQDQKDEAAEAYQKAIQDGKGAPPPPGSVTVIEAAPISTAVSHLTTDREKILREVFMDRNPATMSDDEYARIQMERMLPPDEPKEEEHGSDSEDDETHNAKQKKASQWADWKDDHAQDGNMGANIG